MSDKSCDDEESIESSSSEEEDENAKVFRSIFLYIYFIPTSINILMINFRSGLTKLRKPF